MSKGLQSSARAALVVSLALAAFGCDDDSSERRAAIYALGEGNDPAGEASIREYLTDTDPDVRATALNALVIRRTDDAGRVARDALTDSHGFVRSMAAKLLGDLGDPTVVDALVERTLSDPEALVRRRSAEALGRIGSEQALEGLRVALSDPNREVRLAVVKAIGKIDPAGANAELARLLLDDSVWQIRVEAARVLGSTGDPEMTAVLERAGEDDNEFVRTAARHALARLAGEVDDDVDG